MRITSWSIILFCLFTSFAWSDERSDFIRANYTKYEFKVPMRDGVKLFTIIYTPNDTSKTYPFLMARTPYSIGPYGADRYRQGLSQHVEFEKKGFIFVFQDVRGRFMSEGDFVHMTPHNPNKKSKNDVDESTDTYDSIEWLLKHVPNHNGKIGQWGISYPGFYASAGAIDSHPALKAVSPQAPIGNFYGDDVFHHGAFLLPHIFWFNTWFLENREGLISKRPDPVYEMKTPDSYHFYREMGSLKNANEKYLKDKSTLWNDVIQHPTYDEYWQSRNILPHLKKIKAAVMVVGGWYDREDLFGALKTYQAIEKNNPKVFNMLVMGPWVHGGWAGGEGSNLGDEDFGMKTTPYYQEHVDFVFFKHFLKDDSSKLNLPEALIFETGANRWRQFDRWPPKDTGTANLYLDNKNTLTWEPPTSASDEADTYISDPKKPVPYTDEITQNVSNKFYAEDQRFASRRPDVLAYQTDILKEDTTIAGPIQVELFVSTTGTDSDWIVKLIDVVPEEMETKGAQETMVRIEAFRGRYRESYEKPKPFIPNEIVKISFELQDVLHTFKRDHRIMIQIQSTCFPFIDRNPQKYVTNIFQANEDDFITVTNSIHRSKIYPSRIEFKTLNPGL